MTTSFKQTKTKTYLRYNGQLFVTNNNWSDRTLTLASQASMNEQQLHAINTTEGWQEVESAGTIDAVYDNVLQSLKRARDERKASWKDWRTKAAETREKEWATIAKLSVIPATADNIRILLEHLNRQNWGGWALPKMSIGYSAAQYDCDGVVASTLTLDKPIYHEGKMVRRFKVGGKHGHLTNYTRV